MLGRLETLCTGFPASEEIALRDGSAVVNISTATGRAGAWIRVDAMLARLRSIADAFGESLFVAEQGGRRLTIGDLVAYVQAMR